MPANTIHLIRLLDINIFKPFDLVLRKCVLGFMLESAITKMSKKDAMTIGSKSRREGIESKTTNIYSGFISACLWTLSFPDVQRRLKLFNYVVIALSEENPFWMMCRETA